MIPGIDYSVIDHIDSLRINDRVEAGPDGEYVGRIRNFLPNGKAVIETKWGNFTADLTTAKLLKRDDDRDDSFSRPECVPYDDDPVNFHELDRSLCDECNASLTMSGRCAQCGKQF